MQTPDPSEPAARALDAADPLRRFRSHFDLPAGLIYLDGNSLGPLAHAVRDRLRRVIDEEWGKGLIRRWNEAGWFVKPNTVGDRLARLVGAGPGELVVCDSTSVNIFKVLVAAMRMRPGRQVIVSEAGNFPTDLYVAQGVQELLPGAELRLAGVDGSLEELLSDGSSVAAVLLTHVDYRTGRMHDMKRTTEVTHRAGALMIWDLAHSAGAVPLDVAACNVDFAVGCTYKYLNAGPGGPAFVFVARRHQAQARQPLTGWNGHAAPFAFTTGYEPDSGIRRFLCGTPPILSFAPLEASLDIWDQVDLAEVRRKSLALADLFIAVVDQRCAGLGLSLATPRDRGSRGSQVSLRHPEGYAVMQVLIARGVIGDFRAPDLLRFGFAPLYVSYEDAFRAASILAEVLQQRSWDRPEFKQRKLVT